MPDSWRQRGAGQQPRLASLSSEAGSGSHPTAATNPPRVRRAGEGQTTRLTALGWKGLTFFATLLGAFFAAPYQNLYFLLLAFLCAIAALNLVWTTRNVAGVAGEIERIPPIPAGAPAQVRVTIDARRRRRLGIRAVVDLGAGRRVATDCALLRGTTHVLCEIPALPRGIHTIRDAALESTYPLGLLRVRRTIPAPREIVVHPTPAAIPHAPGAGLAGLASALGSSAGADQPSGLRDYRQGDEVRGIHWRATARRGRPVVTEWDTTAGEGLELVLDRRADEHEFEEALSLVAALALAARDAKERLTLHTQGLTQTFGAGHVPCEELLRFLAAAERLPLRGPPPPPAGRSVLRLPLRKKAAS